MGKKPDRKGERRVRGGTQTAGRGSSSQPPPSVDIAAELRRGLDAFRNDDFDAAVTAWRKARRAVAVDSASRVVRALAEAIFRRAIGSANPTLAIRDLEEATQLLPGRAIYRFHLGLAYHRQGQTRRAIATLEEAVRLEPVDDRYRYHLALLVACSARPGADGDADRARARDLLAAGQTLATSTTRLASVLDLMAGRTTEAIATLGAVPNGPPLISLMLGLAYWQWHLEDPAPERLKMAATTFERVYRECSKTDLPVLTLAALGLSETQMASGDFSAAVRTLESLRLGDPPDEPTIAAAFADVNRRLGQELAKGGDLEGAVGAWRRARAAQPTDSPTAQGLSHLLEVVGTQAARAEEYHQAQRYWSLALDAEPDDHLRLQRNLALVAERLERFEEAARLWEGLIRQWRRPASQAKDDQAKHRLAAAYRHLAQSLEESDELAEAAKALERALQSDVADSPEAIEIRERLTRLYRELEQPNRAIEHLKRLLAGRPKDVRILIDLGGAHQYKHDEVRALEYLERARALEPENPAVREALAGAHHSYAHRLADSKLLDRAVEEYRQAIGIEPNDASHWLYLGKAFVKLKRPDEAEAAFKQVIRLEPRDWANQVEAGSAYLESGDRPAADRLFRRALRLAPKKVKVSAMVALLYVKQRALAEAEPYLARVLKSRDAVALNLIANALIGLREYVVSIPYLERLIALSRAVPVVVEAHLTLATAYAMGLNDHARAAAELTRARDLAREQGDGISLATIEEIMEANAILAAKQKRADEARRRKLGV